MVVLVKIKFQDKNNQILSIQKKKKSGIFFAPAARI